LCPSPSHCFIPYSIMSAMPSQLIRTPVAVPNAQRQYLGWNVNAAGVFYICRLPLSSNSDGQHLCQLLAPTSHKIIVQEVHRSVIDHSEWGTFENFKLEEDSYAYHYYHAIFDVYILPSVATEGSNPNHAGLDKAINSCRQPDLDCNCELFAQDLDKFPSMAKQFLRCFVHPVPPPIPLPTPIKFRHRHTPHSWTVGISRQVSI